MAFTRNRNTPGDYLAKTKEQQKQLHYLSYDTSPFYGRPQTTYFAGDGLIGMKAHHSSLSKNFSDVESFLFGIGATNLINPQPEFRPEIKQMKSLNIITKIPQIMPDPFIHYADQRPMPLN